MAKTIEKIRELLKEEGRKKVRLESEKGCCQIHFGGSTANKSGIDERACRRIANDFPGATYTFHPGVSCSEV
jgi:hypothetical protein